MNRKQFLVSLAVLVVLAAAAAAVVLSDRSAWNTVETRTGQKIVPGLKIADVAEVAIQDSSGQLHLVRAAPTRSGSAPKWPTWPSSSPRATSR